MTMQSRGVSTAAFVRHGDMSMTGKRTVTAIQEQVRNRNRVNVHLNGEFAFGLAAIVAAGLQIGQVLSPGDIDELRLRDSLEKAKESAYRFLSYRPRSVVEMRQSLQRKGFDEAIIDQVVAGLAESALLDDRAFARYWIEQRVTFRPRSRLALRQELYEKGIDRDWIEEAVSDVDEMAAAARAAEKNLYRWRSLSEEAFRVKAVQFLRRRGFDFETSQTVTKDMWQSIAGVDE
jgi:regulatory protein